MFPTSTYGAKFKLDNQLTYKVNKFRKGKSTVFTERSPGEVQKDMINWTESNLESFKSHVFMAMASHDIDFETWISDVRSNDFIGDEFCLSALCQMCQRHALVVTSVKL